VAAAAPAGAGGFNRPHQSQSEDRSTDADQEAVHDISTKFVVAVWFEGRPCGGLFPSLCTQVSANSEL
jgi:hypothetical protein